MNLFIGILSSNFDLYEDRSRELFIRQRAYMIINFWSRPDCNILTFLRTRCGRRCRRVVVRPIGADEDMSYLWYALRAEPGPGDIRSIRTTVSQTVSEEVTGCEKRQERKRHAMEKRLTENMSQNAVIPMSARVEQGPGVTSMSKVLWSRQKWQCVWQRLSRERQDRLGALCPLETVPCQESIGYSSRLLRT